MNGFFNLSAFVALLGIGLLGPAVVSADLKGLNSRPMDPHDIKVMKDVAQVSVDEIELGKLGMKNGTNRFGMSFGERMVNDHTEMLKEIKSLAERNDVRLPQSMDQEHRATYAHLQVRVGKSFDKGYCKAMMTGHEKAEKMFRKEAETVTDPALKAYLEKYVPTIKTHRMIATEVWNSFIDTW